MICPYNGFKECRWEECAARMKVRDPQHSGHLMRVCAIAYNGGVPGAVPEIAGTKNGKEG